MMGAARLNFLCRNSAISEAEGGKLLKWIGIGLGLLILAAVIGLSVMAGSLRGAYGMVRYAFPHMHRGTLRVGDVAPDASLLALDGSSRFHIRERTGARPLVIVFGSYT
jgi:heme A synthase